MGKVYEALDEGVQAFIQAQPMFFVGSAPLSQEGHINISPKGLDSLRVLGPKQVAYIDLVGSGVETIAHIRENSRLVMMFCAFSGSPRILRLHGKGEVIEPHDEAWDALASLFPSYLAARSIICLQIQRIADSCGYGVPLMELQGQRDQAFKWAERKGEAGIKEYKKLKNAESLDGLPGLTKP